MQRIRVNTIQQSKQKPTTQLEDKQYLKTTYTNKHNRKSQQGAIKARTKENQT